MEALPELYAIFQGEVATVTEYGAFIKIPGCRKQGLVHRTHMSSCRVDKPSEIVDVGDKVWVKLIGKEMKDDKLKLSLSMKVVNQGTGKDLDPNNVSLDQDERKKRTFRDYTSQKITLEAVLNTVCKKCGCKGHFAKECFMQPGGTKYTLIPEEEEEEVAAAGCERDRKTSTAEDSSKKRKKVWPGTLLPWCCLRPVTHPPHLVEKNHPGWKQVGKHPHEENLLRRRKLETQQHVHVHPEVSRARNEHSSVGSRSQKEHKRRAKVPSEGAQTKGKGALPQTKGKSKSSL